MVIESKAICSTCVAVDTVAQQIADQILIESKSGRAWVRGRLQRNAGCSEETQDQDCLRTPNLLQGLYQKWSHLPERRPATVAFHSKSC